MPIDVVLISPDGNTTITLRAAKVVQRIQREVRLNANPGKTGTSSTDGGRAVTVDLNKYIKQFTITASITTGSALDQAQYEAIEDASQRWIAQTDNEGLTLFRYSTKDDSTNKDYRVIWNSVDLVEDVETAPQVYLATIVLQESHVRGGRYQISGTAGI